MYGTGLSRGSAETMNRPMCDEAQSAEEYMGPPAGYTPPCTRPVYMSYTGEYTCRAVLGTCPPPWRAG